MSRPIHKPRVLDYVACYALYVLFLGVTGLTFLMCQSTIRLIVDMSVEDIFVNRFIYMAATVILGLVTLILAVSAEHYLHNGVKRRILLKRFARLAIPLIGLTILCFAAQRLIFLFVLG